MKLNLHKKTLKQLSQDYEVLPSEVTPHVAGGSDKYLDLIRFYDGGGATGECAGGSGNCQSDDGASA